MRKSSVFLLKEINVIAKKFLSNCVRMVQKFREMFFMDDTEKPMSFYAKKIPILQCPHRHRGIDQNIFLQKKIVKACVGARGPDLSFPEPK